MYRFRKIESRKLAVEVFGCYVSSHCGVAFISKHAQTLFLSINVDLGHPGLPSFLITLVRDTFEQGSHSGAFSSIPCVLLMSGNPKILWQTVLSISVDVINLHPYWHVQHFPI